MVERAGDPAPVVPSGTSDEPPGERPPRIDAVLQAAEESGLRAEKDGRIAGRVSTDLIRRAKARTGLTSDTELIEFALANVALDDDFAATFRAQRGTVDSAVKLGF